MIYHEIWRLLRDTFFAWLDDRAQSMGAALAFYTLFSLVPLSIIVIAIVGAFFGQQAAEGQLVAQIQELIGKQGATTIQAIIESARNPMAGLATVIVGLTQYCSLSVIKRFNFWREVNDGRGRSRTFV